VEDSEPVASIRVSHVVGKFTELGVLGADVLIVRGSNGRLLSIEPVTVSVRATRMITAEDVVRISDPEAGWSLVSVE